VRIKDLIESRLLLVTGKGGTGKTTISVALARVAASEGRKVLLLELDNQRSALPEFFGTTPVFEPTLVEKGLYLSNVIWKKALEDYLAGEVPVARVVRLVLSNRMVNLFLEATPGAPELSLYARILHLREDFDTVVVDLPASGHATSFFRVPHRSLQLFRVGPIHKLCERVIEVLGDATTRTVIASMPEEMVLNETIETWNAIRRLAPEMSAPEVILNQCLLPSLSPGELTLLARVGNALGVGSGDAAELPVDRHEELGRELLRAGLWEIERERTTAEAIERIQRETRAEVFLVPMMVSRGSANDIATRLENLFLRAMLTEGQPGAHP
jgi:hypothetical protein